MPPDPVEVQALRMFKCFKTPRAKLFYSTRATNVKRRSTQSDSLIELSNFPKFLEHVKKSLNHEGYIHALLVPAPRNTSKMSATNTHLICIDIDTSWFGEYTIELLEFLLEKGIQDGRLTFYNRTPRGYHFFFLELNALKVRKIFCKLAIGISVDYLRA